ncbi:MAG TPA: multicopper oxidase family protein [Polyangiaceae bacterium]|nr:multicopper oxidase family protein [Polyangiaceae bacterium]
MKLRSLSSLVFALAACGGSTPERQPEGWNAALALPEALDRSPDPNVLEVDLTARVADVEVIPGKTTPVWTYNGGLPGPLLRAKVGDRLVVHFKNELPEGTTVHWHGVRLPAVMDGTPGHSQPEVMPGGSFEYDFVLPDAGLYWYHPHLHSAAQVGFGLYGALLVEDPADPSDLGDELVLVLSDMGVREDGTLEDPESGGDFGTLFGREGDALLVNGKRNPTLIARAGLRQRWRLVNAAKSRYFQVTIAGHTFTKIGGDGGLASEPQETSALVLTPGERADVLVTPRGTPGSTLPVEWVPFDRGYGATFNRPVEELFQIRLSSDPAAESPALPTIQRTIAPLDLSMATPISLELTSGAVDGKLVMGINGVPSWDAAPIPAKLGDTHLFTVKNTMVFAHPFHLHGFFFQPLDEAGAPLSPMEWKDTIDVPVDGSARFAVHYDDRPGMWMFHCHILDHADAGMMGMIDLAHAH